MSAHTPGPWEVCGHFVRTPFRHGEPENAGLMVADVRFGIWPAEQHEANARLIASAPELLAHLKFAVKLLSAFPAMSSTAQVEAMRAAIAKAEAAQ